MLRVLAGNTPGSRSRHSGEGIPAEISSTASVRNHSLPPLRERTEDVPDLVRYFIQRHARELAVPDPAIQTRGKSPGSRSRPGPATFGNWKTIVRQPSSWARPLAITLDHVQHAIRAQTGPHRPANQTHAAYIATSWPASSGARRKAPIENDGRP